MSVTYGFYNSINGDRKYSATQMNNLLSGVINDGVFTKIGERFKVTAIPDTTTVRVSSGKCWFNNTWTENDSDLVLDCGASSSGWARYDVVVIEVDTRESVRANSIKVINGTETTENAVLPDISSNEEGVYRYPICEIYRPFYENNVTQDNITDLVGSPDTPWVTGILETVSLDERFGNWRAQMQTFADGLKAHAMSIQENNEKDFNEWYSQMKTLMADVVNETNTWSENQKSTILAWFDELKGQLEEGDIATGLTIKLNRAEIEHILVNGFTNGTKTFSEDGTTITSVDSLNRKLVKTFSNDFLTSTTVLTDSNGVELGCLVKNFSSDVITSSSEIATLI